MTTTQKLEKKYFSFIYLLIAFVSLFFVNGQWILPIAVFVAPVLLIRFLKFHRPWIGFLLIIPVGWVTNIVTWKGVMPIDGILFYIITFELSLFVALVYLADRVYSKKITGFISTLVFPSVFVILEFILVYSVPAGSIGKHAHTQSNLVLLQILSLTGIWGVTFLITWTASVINWLWEDKFETLKLRKAFIFYGLPVLGVLLFGQIRIHNNPIQDETVRIASVTLDKNLEREYYSISDIEEFDRLYNKIGLSFIESCEKAVQVGAKIIFGQETLLGIWHENEQDYLENIKQIALRDSIYIGLSIALITEEARNNQLPGKNKIIWISPEGKIVSEYYKAKPMYGKRIYGDGILQYFDTPYGRICSAICYDMDFLSVVNQIRNKNIDIMLDPSNDWKDITPYHTYLASARAIEHGFNMVRSTGHGLSASFDYKGQVLSKQNYFNSSENMMLSDVPTKGVKTIYSFMGDYFAYLCMLFFLVSTIIVIRKWSK